MRSLLHEAELAVELLFGLLLRPLVHLLTFPLDHVKLFFEEGHGGSSCRRCLRVLDSDSDSDEL